MRDKLINKKFVIIAIALVFLLTIGFSYAWWRLSFVQDKANTAVSKCLKLELANQANEINLTNMYPISDEEGKALTPLTFTLKNTCSMSAKYTLNLEMLEGTTLNSNYLAVLVNNKDIKLLSSYNTAITVVKGSTESRTLDTGVLQANGSKDYSISIWMDKNVTLADDAQNKTFKSKVVVDAEATETVADKIIAQLDTTGKCPVVNDNGTIYVSKSESTDGYICSAPDAYGTSYYYRGNVINNYVKFGKWSDDAPVVVRGYCGGSNGGYIEYASVTACQNAGYCNQNCTVVTDNAGKDMYWRIIRVNGDGTFRLIYDGTVAHSNSEKSEDRQIGYSGFNNEYDDNTYIGYMYSEKNKLFEEHLTSSLQNTSSLYIAKEYILDESKKTFTLKDPFEILASDLTTDYIGYYKSSNPNKYSDNDEIYMLSSITAGDTSTTVDYTRMSYGTSSSEEAQTNLHSSTIKKYLDDWYKTNILGSSNELFLTDNIFCNDRSINSHKVNSNYSNLGYWREQTSYRFGWGYSNNILLTCPQRNDAFTVSDTVNGNGALTYPIGLVSADEGFLAGGSSNNNNYYLYSGIYYWTSSPYRYDTWSSVNLVTSYGSVYGGNGTAYWAGVRPVINIKPEALKFGSGTMDDPYHL